MTNEIKEIINNLIEYRNSDYKCKQPEDCLTIEDVWLLLDYITNLQEENEIYQADYENLLILGLKQETHFNFKCEDLQQRIDKALKYIKKQKPWWEEWHYDMCGVDDDIKEIENILRGDE